MKDSELQLVSELRVPSLEERNLPLATTCAPPDLSLLHWCSSLGCAGSRRRYRCCTQGLWNKLALVKWFFIPHLQRHPEDLMVFLLSSSCRPRMTCPPSSLEEGSEEKEGIELGSKIEMWVNREEGEVGFLSRNLRRAQ